MAELTAARQATLRQRLSYHHPDVDGYVEMMGHHAQPCPVPKQDNSQELFLSAVAREGTDGRWHLVVPSPARGEPATGDVFWLCGSKKVPGGGRQHRESVQAWTDGSIYRVHPRGEGGMVIGFDLRWSVQLTPVVRPPEAIPRRQRCSDTHPQWPPAIDERTSAGRIRIRLQRELGRVCHCCRVRIGSVIEHDHATGMVRGLVCRDCNAHLDRCTHVSGCAFSNYLEAPPAAEWALRYPRHSETVRRQQGGRR